VAKPGAILASNTSTLNIDTIAHFTTRPADVLGMAISFSPATNVQCASLEIVPWPGDSDESSASILAAMRRSSRKLDRFRA